MTIYRTKSILRRPIRYDSIYRYRNDISVFSIRASLLPTEKAAFAEADLGMFSMFGRTGPPTKAQRNHFLQHGIGNKPKILK